MSAAAVIVLRRKRLIRAFREAGATDASRAVTLEQLGQRRSWLFEQMNQHGAFTAVAQGRYFINPAAAEAFLAARRRRALMLTGFLLLLFLLFWLFSQLLEFMDH